MERFVNERFIIDTCCGCAYVDLRVGSLFIAYTYLILDVMISTVILSGTLFLEAARDSVDEVQKHRIPVIESTEGVMLGLLLLLLPFIAMLLVGLHKRIMIYIKIWLMGSLTFIMLELTMFFVSFAYVADEVILSFRLVTIFVELYFFFVVRSYYLKTRQ